MNNDATTFADWGPVADSQFVIADPFEIMTNQFPSKNVEEMFLSVALFIGANNKKGLSIGGKLYSKFSFGEVYRRIYGRKFSFTATRKRSCKTGFPNVYPTIYLPKLKF